MKSSYLLRTAVITTVPAAVVLACGISERPSFDPPSPAESKPPSTTSFDESECGGSACPPDLCEAAKTKQTSEGCAFYTTIPDAYDGQQGCYAVFLNNTTSYPAEVRLRFGEREISGSKFLYVPEGSGDDIRYTSPPDGRIPASSLAIAFLAGPRSVRGYGPCPAEPAVRANYGEPREPGFARVFVLTTSQPVVATDIYPYGGADSHVTGASPLLPVNAWGKSYVTAVAGGGVSQASRSWIDLVAETETVVRMRPMARELLVSGMPRIAVGETYDVALRAGEVYHFVQTSDVSGVALSSDHPFMTIAGTRCFGEPCDASHQQLPSVPTLASEYTAVGHRDRLPNVTPNEEHWWRIVGAANGTTLTYSPSIPDGAPTTLELGSDPILTSRTPFVVRSQDSAHPFYLAEYMTSCLAVDPANANGCPGDPEFTGVVSPTQFSSSYLFFTDPTYPTSHLVVIRVRGEGGSFEDVELDCAGTLRGWSRLDDRYEYTRFDLVTDGENQGACRNGRHEMKSKALFGVTVWGWGRDRTRCTSYAFPGGLGLRPINDVTVK